MRKLLLAFPLALALSFAVAPEAVAGAADSKADEDGPPSIEDTGITLFDSVFSKVRNIHDTIGSLEGRLIGIQDRIAAAVGQPAGTSVRMSMWQLKQIAGGPINVEMRDNKPYLTLGGAGSNEVKSAIEQINGVVPEAMGVIADLQKLPPQVMELVNACKALPAQLNPQLLQEAGMSPMQLPKIAKTVGNNVKAAVATPDRIQSLIETGKDLLTGIPEGIAATAPPTDDYMAAKKEEKGKEKAAEKAAKSSGGGGGGGGTSSAGGGGSASLDAIAGTPVGGAINTAWLAFQDAEVDHAVMTLGQADADLSRATSVVSRQELGALYQTQALVFMVDGNPAAASAAVAKALMVDPAGAPMAELGPEYAKLHKALAKAGILRTVRVTVQGSGRAWISGVPVEGNATIDVPKGEHLIQVEKNGQIVSTRMLVDDGFVLTL